MFGEGTHSPHPDRVEALLTAFAVHAGVQERAVTDVAEGLGSMGEGEG